MKTVEHRTCSALCCESPEYPFRYEREMWKDEVLNTMLQFELGGRTYGFTVKSMSERDRDWLADVVVRQMNEAYQQGRYDEQKELRQKFHTFAEALGL